MSKSSPIAELYTDHHTWLQGWLRRKLGCLEQAADLAHDTFVRAMTTPKLEEIREPRAWLRTVAHGVMVNHLKRQDLERAYCETLATQPELTAPSPEERALILETLMQIDALLDGLSPKARRAFLLSQLDGLTYAEIAVQLNVSVSMIKKYMLQAITHCMQINLT